VGAAAPDKPGGGLISMEELAEKNAAVNGTGAIADGTLPEADHVVAIEPLDGGKLDKEIRVSPHTGLQ